MYAGKLGILDFVIAVLLRHEKDLDNLLERLEKAVKGFEERDR